METETNPNLVLKPPPLNSDQLNYLIWRYLQEAGYGEAAVKLQRDWKVEPDTLPFAKHIKGQALVSLVQKGLRYHHLSLTVDENGLPPKQTNPATFFFGPESGRPSSSNVSREPLFHPIEVPRASSPLTSSSSQTKKRESDANGPLESIPAPTKRNRKPTSSGNVDRNGNGVRKVSATEPMATTEVDYVNGNGPVMRSVRSPSASENVNDENIINGLGSDTRMDVEMEDMTPGLSGTDAMQPETNDLIPPPLVHTLTNGESVGIQVAPAKVANLGPSTTILTLPEKSNVTRTIWRPSDGSLLTVAGEHFCGTTKGGFSSAQHVNPNLTYQDLLGFDASILITAIAWEPNGGLLAIATYADQTGQLHLFDGRELILIENLPASQRAITSLKWLPSAFRLVGIAPYEDQSIGQGTSSTILLWDFANMQFSASPLTLTVPEILLDVDSARYSDQGMICAAGGNAVYHCRADKELLVESKWVSPASDGTYWAFVKCSWHDDNSATIVAASSDNARIWLPLKNIIKDEAHEAPITGLDVRPRAFQSSDSSSIIEFASSSMDGTIKVWRTDPHNNSIEVVYKLSINRSFPIMSLSYSPDGFCLAGASFNNAHIWNAEHGYNLMASWEGKSDEWRGTTLKDEDVMSAGGYSNINSEGGSTGTDHSLAWDVDSKKLAFGLASQVAIMNFQR